MSNDTDGDIETESFIQAPWTEVPVEYNKRDLLLYALGIGSSDPKYTYERHPDFGAFPTYPIVLTFKGDSFDVLNFPSPSMRKFPMPVFKGFKFGLDAEKYIEKVAELPPSGAKLVLRGGILGIHKKGSGALVEMGFEVRDAAGKLYYRIVSGNWLVGATGFKDAGAVHSKLVPPPTSPPTITIDVPTDEHIANIYRLSGDYNPLHVDLATAKAAGYEKPILHGLCTLGHTTRVVLEYVAGGNHRRFKSVQMRFASPVVPGQALKVEIWVVSPNEVVFQTLVKETGKICISNGRLILHPGPKM